jgi:hypothetical protein
MQVTVEIPDDTAQQLIPVPILINSLYGDGDGRAKIRVFSSN